MKADNRVESMAVVIATGVNPQDRREVLGGRGAQGAESRMAAERGGFRPAIPASESAIESHPGLPL